MRNCITNECYKIYIINLRGDIRKNILSKGSAKEGENIFGQGSMTPICISFLIKNNANSKNKIYYFDIGDDRKRDEKLSSLNHLKSIKSLINKDLFQIIQPSKKNTWINQGDELFQEFTSVSDKKNIEKFKIFNTHSMGIKSNRDGWVFNFSKKNLEKNIKTLIHRYQEQLVHFGGLSKQEIKGKVPRDKSYFSWTDDVLGDLSKRKNYIFKEENIRPAIYRPFTYTNWYGDNSLNWTSHLMGKFFLKMILLTRQ